MGNSKFNTPNLKKVKLSDISGTCTTIFFILTVQFLVRILRGHYDQSDQLTKTSKHN
jgi:hypothetical protein